jgi:ABC-type multidrug transport system ATPase subunit
MIGRGPKNKDESPTPRLELDSEIISISSSQAEIKKSGGVYVLHNHNPSTTGRTIVNGDQNFDEHKLVLGDCIQIPNCDFYTFKFTGDSLRHISPSGNLVGSQLVVDVPGARILHPVDLEVPKGGFLGIIGGSGQGKSTLMNALCGIVPASSGTVKVAGAILRSPREVAKAGIGYVPQDDIVHRELSVEDALSFAARLRLSATREQIRDVVDATMEVLRLTEHRKKCIANLSGGQRKRVSIASELLTSPDFLFLDEPTSGLDPLTENQLMQELQTLAVRKRMGIACTTHVLQTAYILSRLAFISRGRLIFHGSPVEAVRFFLLSGTPDGAASSRTSTDSLLGASASSTAAASVIGDERHEITDSYLLERVSKIYGVAQDTTRPIPDQDKTAQDWEREYKASVFFKPLPVETEADRNIRPPRTKRVGAIRTLVLLMMRQWKLLISSRLNYLFLAAQSVVIGLLIGWVDDDPVLQSFLSLIATLWFGCSNGAQQIVGELAIFRRERLAGLGIHTYLLSKFVFLTAITCVQAVVLYFFVLGSTHVFHAPREEDPERELLAAEYGGKVPDKATRDFRHGFFDKPPAASKTQELTPEEKEAQAEQQKFLKEEAARQGITVEELDRKLKAEFESRKAAAEDFDVLGDGGPGAPAGGAKTDSAGAVASLADAMPEKKPQPQAPARVFINPTGLEQTSREYQVLEFLAWLFRMRENVLDHLKIYPVDLRPGESPASVEWQNGIVSWKSFVGTLLLLRFGALLAAAMVGVALGLAVSSLVKTPTQAVMWVPLILIPQILFGAFVVTTPEMDDDVLGFSRSLPSFNLQRIMDVAHIYGRLTPRMTNQTKIPAFFTPPDKDEKVWWKNVEGKEDQVTLYMKASDANKSWQNLIVDRRLLGQREKEKIKPDVDTAASAEPETPTNEIADTVKKRQDVLYSENDAYLDLVPASMCGFVLGGWVLSCYIVAFFSLRHRQTGR